MSRFAPLYRPSKKRDLTRPVVLGALLAAALLYSVTWLNVNEARWAARAAAKSREVRKLQQEIVVLEAEVERREQAVVGDSVKVNDLGLEWPRPGRLVVLDARSPSLAPKEAEEPPVR
jgi:hypothetical protein